MSGNRPGVSIVITSYNYARFLPRALESALAQDWPGLEIVVVDNASTDESWSIIEAACADARVRAHRNAENIGLVGNHNRGLELARGERVLFLSADDYLLPGHVSRVAAMHAAHPDVDLFFSTYFKVDEADRVIGFLGHPGHLRGSYAGGRNEFADLLTHDCYTCFPTTLFDRDELAAQGGLDPEINAFDYELYIRLARAGKRFGFIDTPGACIRLHGGAASGEERYVASGKQFIEHLHVLQRHLVPETYPLVAGRENGLARLLNAKLANLRGYPGVAQQLLPAAKPVVDALAGRLAESLAAWTSRAPDAAPSISVIVRCTDDFQAALDTIGEAVRQRYAGTELVLVADASMDPLPLLLDRAGTLPVRIVRHSAPRNAAAAYDDALALASGEIVVYGEPGAAWPDGHLARVAQHLQDRGTDVLVVPVDLIATRGGAPVARFADFAGSAVAADEAFPGESVPLCAIAHRRQLVDRIGLFQERLAHCAEYEFVSRIAGNSKVVFDRTLPIALHKDVQARHPALADPNGYLSSLSAIYASRPGAQTQKARNDAHLQHLQSAIPLALRSADAGGIFRFWSDARGIVPQAPAKHAHPARPRVLVIDDRVPYRELGRGYPRAHDALDALKTVAGVTFYPLIVPEDDPQHARGVDGIEVLYGRGTALLASTLEERLPEVDVLWVSRPHNMDLVRKALDGIPGERAWKLVYDAEAIYAHRDIIKAQLSGAPLSEQTQKDLVDREVALLAGADAVFAVSPGDRDEIARRCSAPVRVLSFSLAPSPAPEALEDRAGLLFVGAIEPGSPNEDALAWFVQHVSPQRPGLRVTHVGVMTSQALRAAAESAVEFCGAVPDLRDYYGRARIFIAPTRFAAGLPQKVYEAAAHGLPVIATPLLARQLGWRHERELLVADSPQEWAAAIDRLSGDAHLWHTLRGAALEAVRRDASPGTFNERILETLAALVPHASCEGGFQPPLV